MNTLYKFTLDEETGKISVQEITDYEDGKWINRERYWRYRGKSCWMYVYKNKLDKFLSGHVYSFDPDILHAKSIIMNTVKIRRAKAKREYERWNDVFEKLRRD